jgi:hypothetical protein
MKKIGKMSIIPIRDWMKNIPSKQTSTAAARANQRLGCSRNASRYISGTQSVPKMQGMIRQPKGTKPRSAGSPDAPSTCWRHQP